MVVLCPGGLVGLSGQLVCALVAPTSSSSSSSGASSGPCAAVEQLLDKMEEELAGLDTALFYILRTQKVRSLWQIVWVGKQ